MQHIQNAKCFSWPNFGRLSACLCFCYCHSLPAIFNIFVYWKIGHLDKCFLLSWLELKIASYIHLINCVCILSVKDTVDICHNYRKDKNPKVIETVAFTFCRVGLDSTYSIAFKRCTEDVSISVSLKEWNLQELCTKTRLQKTIATLKPPLEMMFVGCPPLKVYPHLDLYCWFAWQNFMESCTRNKIYLVWDRSILFLGDS